MKKLLKWLAILIGIFFIGMFILYLVFNEKKPTSQQGPQAEALAQKMLKAIDKPGWDTTGVVQWTFAGMNHYLWDKKRHLVKIEWGEDMKVLLNPNLVDGKAYKGETELSGDEAKAAIQKAWSNWCNDSFWLNAPAKCMDPGTSRGIVNLEDGSQGLMVSYDSGGVTPGDSYLWILDEQGLPKAWKMWVKIIPVGGFETSWENYQTLYSGAKVAGLHKSKIFDLPISNIKAADQLSELGVQEDPFASIAN